MKVEKIDYVWAVLSFIAVGVSFHFGYLLYGIVGIFLALAGLMFCHIAAVRKMFQRTVAVYGRVTGYHTDKGVVTHYFPMVSFETEDGRTIDTICSAADSKQKYEIGAEEMICYDPDDPMLFYFSSCENEFAGKYYKLMIFAVIAAAVTFIISQIMIN